MRLGGTVFGAFSVRMTERDAKKLSVDATQAASRSPYYGAPSVPPQKPKALFYCLTTIETCCI